MRGHRFQKLPPASNGKFLRCLIVFFSLHMAKHGPDMLLDQLERVQASCSSLASPAGLFPMYAMNSYNVCVRQALLTLCSGLG